MTSEGIVNHMMSWYRSNYPEASPFEQGHYEWSLRFVIGELVDEGYTFHR